VVTVSHETPSSVPPFGHEYVGVSVAGVVAVTSHWLPLSVPVEHEYVVLGVAGVSVTTEQVSPESVPVAQVYPTVPVAEYV
jgi:hypothetical protein